MQSSLPLVGLLACSLLLPSFSALCSQVDIDGLDLSCSGYARSWGSVVSLSGFTSSSQIVYGPFSADNSPTIWVEEAYLTSAHSSPYSYILTAGTVYVEIRVDYGNGYEDNQLLGVITNCRRGDSTALALYCNYPGVAQGITFSKERWNDINKIKFTVRTMSVGVISDLEDEYTPNIACSAVVWLKCDVIPYVDPDVPDDPDLSDILKEEKRINNSIVNGNGILSDINNELRNLSRRDFEVEVNTSGVERKLDAIDSSIDAVSSEIENSTLDITGAIDGIGDDITGAIDGLADSIGDGINVEVGDVSVETDISWFQEGEGDTDLGEFDTDDVVSRSDYNSLFDPIGRATGALYLADRTSTFWNDFSGSSSSPLVLARLPENMGGGTINLPTWSDVSLVTGQDENSGLLSNIPAFIGACIGLIVSLCLFTWIYNLITR